VIVFKRLLPADRGESMRAACNPQQQQRRRQQQQQHVSGREAWLHSRGHVTRRRRVVRPPHFFFCCIFFSRFRCRASVGGDRCCGRSLARTVAGLWAFSRHVSVCSRHPSGEKRSLAILKSDSDSPRSPVSRQGRGASGDDIMARGVLRSLTGVAWFSRGGTRARARAGTPTSLR
jgi:hypothetical protein